MIIIYINIKYAGSLAGTPIKLKKSLQVIIPKFKPISEPKSSDW